MAAWRASSCSCRRRAIERPTFSPRRSTLGARRDGGFRGAEHDGAAESRGTPDARLLGIPPPAPSASRQFARDDPVDAVVGVDERTAVVAAGDRRAAGACRTTRSTSVAAAGTRPTCGERLARAGVPSPRHRLFHDRRRPASRPRRRCAYPCVLKPTFLAASRGVIRADDPAQFVRRGERIARILAEPEVARAEAPRRERSSSRTSFPAPEVALEGLADARASSGSWPSSTSPIRSTGRSSRRRST